MTVRGHSGGRALARNSALNAAGQLAPLLVAVAVLPYLLGELGPERFALLTLAWTIIGYFGFLDLGLGRATTQFVAGLLGADRAGGVNRVVWSSLTIQTVLGTAGALAIAALASVLARDVLRVTDPALLAETQSTLRLVALGLPLVLLSGTFSGVLEAYQRFDLMNLVRVPSSIATLIIPTAGVAFQASLPSIVLGIVVARACALLCFGGLAVRIGGVARPVRPHVPTLRRLLGFGGWLTVSLMAVPILTYAERLLIGGLRSLTELAYYAVPFEIVARTAIIPSAIALTLFPAFSHAQRSGAQVDQLFRRPMRLLFLLQWPLLVMLWLFPGDILAAWIGPDVADAGEVVLRLLAAAFFLNAFSQVALAGIQGLGRPDLKARLDLVEVPLFILLAVLMIPRFGIAGAAGAKLLVSFADTALLFLFAGRLNARPMIDWSRLRRHPAAAGATILVVSLVGFSAAAPLTIRIVAAVAGIILLGGAVWMRALDGADRAAVLTLFGRRAQMKEVTQ